MWISIFNETKLDLLALPIVRCLTYTLSCAILRKQSSNALMTITAQQSMEMYNDVRFVEMILPTELSSGLINGDWSVLDYIDDEEYNRAVRYLMDDIDNDGLNCVDVIDDNSFCKYHDMTEYGVLATDCSTFIFKVN